MAQQPVLIIGAGIAGPALGIALHRAGIDSVVYEGHPASRADTGWFSNIAPNGVNALAALGIEGRVLAEGTPQTRIAFHDGRGRMLVEVGIGGVAIRCGHLSQGLLAEAADRAHPRRVRQTPRGHRRRRPARRHRTLRRRHLGARTGPHRLRRAALTDPRLLFPDAPGPRYVGLIDSGAITHGLQLPDSGPTMHMTFGSRGFVGHCVRPDDDIWWFTNTPHATEPARGELEAAPDTDWIARILDTHRNDPSPIPRSSRPPPARSDDSRCTTSHRCRDGTPDPSPCSAMPPTPCHPAPDRVPPWRWKTPS